MNELKRIGALERGLDKIKDLITERYPNGAPTEYREIYALAAGAIRESDEMMEINRSNHVSFTRWIIFRAASAWRRKNHQDL